MDAPTLEYALHDQVADILERCTRCGACAEVCPMPGPAGLDTSDRKALTAGILRCCAAAGTPKRNAGPPSVPAAAIAFRSAATASTRG